MKTISVFSGTFDPITNGHMYVIEEATKLYDDVHVVVTQQVKEFP